MPSGLIVRPDGRVPDLLAVAVAMPASRGEQGPEVWVVGSHGVVLVFRPRLARWDVAVSAEDATGGMLRHTTLRGVAVLGSDVWAVGGRHGSGAAVVRVTANATTANGGERAWLVYDATPALVLGDPTDTFTAVTASSGSAGLVAVGSGGIAARMSWNASAGTGDGAWGWANVALPPGYSVGNTTFRGVAVRANAMYVLDCPP